MKCTGNLVFNAYCDALKQSEVKHVKTVQVKHISALPMGT